MAYGAFPTNSHVRGTVRSTKSFWRSQRGIALVIALSLICFLYLNPFNHQIPSVLTRSSQPEQSVRQKVLQELENNGGDPLAPGAAYDPTIEEEEYDEQLSGSGVYPHEWEAVKQTQVLKHKAVGSHGSTKGSTNEDKKAETERLAAEEARMKAEAADASKDRDGRPTTHGDSSSKTALSHGETTSGSKLSVTLDDAVNGDEHTPQPVKQSYPEYNVTTTLVIGRLQEEKESMQWIHNEIRSLTHKRVYVVDDPKAPLHLKQNKGREAMVYLRYILDYYDQLDDVTLFFHPHRDAWHNNVIFKRDAAIMINQLNRSYVQEAGYVNARCELYPGCTNREPGWIKFNITYEEHLEHWERGADLFKPELWDQIFPGAKYPEYLSQPCCSQFAASRELIQSNSRATYQRVHDWLGTSETIDQYTGRIMEYVWQYLFLKQDEYCPPIPSCYRKAYGWDLSDEAIDDLREYNRARWQIDDLLTKVEADNKVNGCGDIDLVTDGDRRNACERDHNPYLQPLQEKRDRSGQLEDELPVKYGITEN